MTRTFQLAAASAATALFALSVPAVAGPAWGTVDSFTVSAQPGGIHSGVGSVDMNITGANVLNGGSAGVAVGGFAVNANKGDLAGDFIAWCLDVANSLDLPSSYHVTDTPFRGNILSGTILDNLTKLANTAYKTVQANLGDDTLSAGFQLALWEIVNETSGSFDLASGDFFAGAYNSGSATNVNASAAAITQANDFLAGLNGNATGNYKLTYLQSEWTGTGLEPGDQLSQDLVKISEVPLPAAGLLLIGALGGLGVFARRRKAAV